MIDHPAPMTIDEALAILDKVANELGVLRNFHPGIFADNIEDECDSIWEAAHVIRDTLDKQTATIERQQSNIKTLITTMIYNGALALGNLPRTRETREESVRRKLCGVLQKRRDTLCRAISRV
jgi:hypothetical protein